MDSALLYTQIHIGPLDIFILDIIAIGFFIIAWSGYSYYTDGRYDRDANLMSTMDQMRWRWMRQMLKRESRIADAGLVGNLLRSISFFANTSIFILIGLITVVGYRESAVDMLNNIPFAMHTNNFMWELKVFNLAVIFIYAFFKFTWSLRQYNYCTILVGAAPMPDENQEGHYDYARKAGNLIANAGRHFNMGLRAYYFGLAAISWFIHPLIFIALTALVVFVVYRREFRSETLNSLAGLGDGY